MSEENANMVDSMEAQGMAEPVSEKKDEIPSAEESSPRLYTADEVDAMQKKRNDKQRASYEAKLTAKQAEYDEIAKELETLKAKNAEYEAKAALDEARMAVAKEAGVAAETLDGATEEEIRAQARALAAFKASQPNYGKYQDSGEHKATAPVRTVPKIF